MKEGQAATYMLLKKKPTDKKNTHFSVYKHQNRWDIYIKNDMDFPLSTTPYVCSTSKPIITILLQPEQAQKRAEITIKFDDTRVIMEATGFSHETKPLGLILYGLDQNHCRVVSFQDENMCVTILPNGTEYSLKEESFYYNCSSERITFTASKHTVMEMKPVFCPQHPSTMYIEGWIDERYLKYLPYLCGILGYMELT